MSFDDEQEAFDLYADAMPDNSTLLVDTYDTLNGVDRAIETARKLRDRGHCLSGIRLDSGDLAWLSQQARSKFDAAGFPEVSIVASNDLDEHLIESLRHQGARIDIWGVGTNLVTAADQPALGGVYKLAALRQDDGSWLPRIKFSEQRAKSSIPGRLQVRRFMKDGLFIGDAIYDIDAPLPERVMIVDPNDPLRRKTIPDDAGFADLLQPVMKGGELIGEPQDLSAARELRQLAVESLHPGILRLDNPHLYPAGIEQGLHERREVMIANNFNSLIEMDTKKISKFLSLVLRHDPDRIGIELDPHGWTDCGLLIDAACRNGVRLDHCPVVGDRQIKRQAAVCPE